MEKKIILSLFAALVLLFSGCVTKQKYTELDELYQKTSKDLSQMTAEKIDYENTAAGLEKEVAALKTHVEKLKKDTLSLTKKLMQSERDYAKAKNDYDELLKDFSDVNTSSKAEISSLVTDLDKTKEELNARERELNEKSAELTAKSAELTAKSAELAEKEANLADLQAILDQKDAEVRNLKEKVVNALQGFTENGLNVYEKNGKVYVSMNDKLLFASAKWDVQTNGEKAIAEVAKILETDTTINVLIEGHTDNVPFRGNGQVKDNWDLSVMRATSVVKTLLKYGHIAPERISASGRGEYYPLNVEDTPAGRAQNRRTEIILTPKLDELFKIIDNN